MSINAILKLVFSILSVFTALIISMPLHPRMPSSGLDPSWQYAINEAAAKGLSFGRDVIFTYGPYGAVLTTMFHPETDTMTMSAGLFFGLCLAGVSVLLIRTASIWWGLLFIYLLAGQTFSRDVIFASYGLFVVIAASNYLDRKTPYPLEEMLIIALTSALGLLPLIKGTLIVSALVSSIATSWLFLAARKPLLASASLIVPAVSMLIFWTLSGQSLGDIVSYFTSMIQIVSGYTEAMAAYGDLREVIVFLAAAAAILWLVINMKKTLLFKLPIFAAFGIFLFAAFKGGFVRHDAHAYFAASAIIVAAVASKMCAASQGRTSPLLWLAVVAWFTINYAYMRSISGLLYGRLLVTYSEGAAGFRDRVMGTKDLKQEYAQALAAIAEEVNIPPVQGTSDIYNYNQAFLLASGNEWRPRPVLQSYSVYTPKLARLERLHLESEQAADNIFFKVETIDGRLPSMDGGSSWPTLLAKYTPSDLQDDYLHLKRRDANLNVSLEEVANESAILGEKVDIPNEDMVYAEITVDPTIFGKLALIFYKTGPLEIATAFADGETRRFRLVSGMGEAGFILSPLVENTSDLQSLFDDREALKDRQIRSVSINGNRLFWRGNYRIKLSALKMAAANQPQENAPAATNQPQENAPAGLPISTIDVCEGYIDFLNGAASLNGAAVTSSTVKTGNSVSLNGWMTVSGKEGTTPDNVYVTFATKNGQTKYFKARRTTRTDVNQYFGQPKMRNAGFAARANLSKLDGDVTLGLARQTNGRLEVCKNLKVTLYRGDAPEPQAAPVGAAPAPAASQYDAVDKNYTDTKEVIEETCEGNIDTVNGGPLSGSENKIAGPMQVQGWTTLSGKDALVPDAVFISLEDSQGKKIYVKTKSTPRDDVKSFFGQPKLPNAGFRTNIDVSAFKGEYTLGLSRLYQGEMQSCGNLSFPVQFEQ